MKKDDIKEWQVRQKYIAKCDQCGQRHELYSQADNNPEYYTNVYLVCPCLDKYLTESLVEFILPVN